MISICGDTNFRKREYSMFRIDLYQSQLRYRAGRQRLKETSAAGSMPW